MNYAKRTDDNHREVIARHLLASASRVITGADAEELRKVSTGLNPSEGGHFARLLTDLSAYLPNDND